MKLIDYFNIKTFYQNEIDKIWNNDLLSYHSVKSYRVVDEIRTLEKRTYKNIFFIRYHDRLEINGSIHKLWNDGLHNANDFYVKDCIDTFLKLINLFKINPLKFTIMGLEYGININLDVNVNDVLKSLRFYGKTQIIPSSQFTNFYFSGTNYKGIKIYNKTQDYPKYSSENNLRFEVKTKKKQFIESLNIYNLSDLLKIDNYHKLKNSILKEWKQVILFDNSIRKLKKFHITEYWIEAIENMSRNTFSDRKKNYFKKLPKNALILKISKQIKNKCLALLNCADLPINKEGKIVHFDTTTKYQNAQMQKEVS